MIEQVKKKKKITRLIKKKCQNKIKNKLYATTMKITSHKLVVMISQI